MKVKLPALERNNKYLKITIFFKRRLYIPKNRMNYKFNQSPGIPY